MYGRERKLPTTRLPTQLADVEDRIGITSALTLGPGPSLPALVWPWCGRTAHHDATHRTMTRD
jgi:hypothetical protein